jgi:predicted KAP-like P-loop ATPase
VDLTLPNTKYAGYFGGMTVVSDAPVGVAGDKLSFRRYIDPLIAILTDPNQQTPFTVGVFGPWGSGKSSLLQMLNERLENDHPDKFVRVWFNPWTYRGEPNLLIPLLHTIRDSLEQDPKERFVESAKKIGEILLRLGAGLLLKTVTADAVSLEKLETLEKQYLEQRFKVESAMRNLRKTLQAEVKTIHEEGAELVLLVDDLDRCDPDQIIALLDSVKLFLDLEHVFVFLAVDREVVRRGIQVRYDKFQFAAGRDQVVGYEYMEKMVQLPVELFPLAGNQVKELARIIIPGDGAENVQVRNLIEKVALPNPRKIKRLLNIFAVVRAFMRKDPELEELDHLTVLRLIALQVQYPELYWEIVRIPAGLEVLEKCYTTNYDLAQLQE